MENKVTTISNIKWKRILIPVIIAVVLIVILANSFTVVDAGHTGVVVTLGKVNEVLKAITATYTAEESITNRQLISDGLVTGLNEKLNDIGLYITDVNIIDFDFSEAFITAIEEKQVAQQKLLKAETEKKTAITNAEAEAEATKIRAEAEAAANDLINKSLTDKVIENKKIEKWNGVLPKVTGSSGTFVDMGDLGE